jgi:hypothetical protein
MWVVPGVDLTNEPGILLSIPGLVVNVATTTDTELHVTATVTMMCGCPITTPTWPQQKDGPEPYWPETEFAVQATLTQPDGTSQQQWMQFFAENTFKTKFPLPQLGSSVGVYAVQPAESNVGYAEVKV